MRLDRPNAFSYKKKTDEDKIMSITVPRVPLPEILPVFPLTGVMLLPGTVLPLHVFEPRYRAMVEDVLGSGRVFGMIQPFTPQDDNRGPRPGADTGAPVLYRVGCAGYIEQCEKLPDGRFFLQLKGVNRFSFSEELELRRGYRRVKASYREFPDDVVEDRFRCDRARVLAALSGYGKAHGMQVHPEQAEKFSDLELINLLAVSLPLHPAEKQALLEARDLKDRETMLIDLLTLDAGSVEAESEPASRTLN
jgi:Lon protease-like protein